MNRKKKRVLRFMQRIQLKYPDIDTEISNFEDELDITFYWYEDDYWKFNTLTIMYNEDTNSYGDYKKEIKKAVRKVKEKIELESLCNSIIGNNPEKSNLTRRSSKYTISEPSASKKLIDENNKLKK